MRNPAWNETEQKQVIELYMAMLTQVKNGRKYSKASMIRETQSLGLARSKGSIESKLMNLSAIACAANRPDLSMAQHGYKALTNYQSSAAGAFLTYVREMENQRASRRACDYNASFIAAELYKEAI